MRSLALVLLVACAPTVDGPVEHQRTLDVADGDRLAAQLAALPGVTHAEVVLRRAVTDPLAQTAPVMPASSMVIVVDDRADKTRIEDNALSLSRAIAPDIEPTVVIEVGAKRARLASVGPLTVEESSKNPLKALLAIALAAIAGLGMWIAYVLRPR